MCFLRAMPSTEAMKLKITCRFAGGSQSLCWTAFCGLCVAKTNAGLRHVLIVTKCAHSFNECTHNVCVLSGMVHTGHAMCQQCIRLIKMIFIYWERTFTARFQQTRAADIDFACSTCVWVCVCVCVSVITQSAHAFCL